MENEEFYEFKKVLITYVDLLKDTYPHLERAVPLLKSEDPQINDHLKGDLGSEFESLKTVYNAFMAKCTMLEAFVGREEKFRHTIDPLIEEAEKLEKNLENTAYQVLDKMIKGR